MRPNSAARRICGRRNEQIAEALGTLPCKELFHQDNRVVIA